MRGRLWGGADFGRRSFTISQQTFGFIAMIRGGYVAERDIDGRVLIVAPDGSRTPAEDAPVDTLLAAYLENLAKDCSQIPFPAYKCDDPTGDSITARALRLADVYVPPDATSPTKPAAQEADKIWQWRLIQNQPAGRLPLLEALAQDRRRRHILIGEAGSGKTTFANYLCAALAKGDSALPADIANLIPLRFDVHDVISRHIFDDDVRGTAEIIWNAVETNNFHLLGVRPASRLRAWIEQLTATRGALFLFDDFDLVPETSPKRRILLTAIAHLSSNIGKSTSRILITSRPSAAVDWRRSLRGFEVVSVSPFNHAQCNTLLQKWNQDARTIGTPLPAGLASRPLHLTMLAMLESNGHSPPEGRSELYEQMIDLLLRQWWLAHNNLGENVARGSARENPTFPDQLRIALEKLAYEMHDRQANVELRNPPTISHEQLLPLANIFNSHNNNRLLDFFRYCHENSGFMVQLADGSYRFAHRTIQELLAGGHLKRVVESEPECLKRLLETGSWWQEPVMLAMLQMPGDEFRNATSRLLPAASAGDFSNENKLHAAILCARALLERPAEEEIAHVIRQQLTALVENCPTSPRGRLEVADVLGRLGDPRPGVGVFASGELSGFPDIDWVEIPAGPFTMGRPADARAPVPSHAPQHEVTLDRFWISRFPVTNAQFRPFVEDGGYENHAFWTEAGWSWRQGEHVDLSVYREIATSYREALAAYLTTRTAKKRGCPALWDEPGWSIPNRPVVGVTWFEARAYAAWLNKQYQNFGSVPRLQIPAVRLAARLPSEAEWEKAARGTDARNWPWGNSFDTSACNTMEIGLDQTVPVGIFSRNRSPYGVADMAGNVWQWTSTIWDPERFRYPYRSDDGREEEAEALPRAIRGGSFYQHDEFARTTARIMTAAGDFRNSIGFRLALVSKNC